MKYMCIRNKHRYIRKEITVHGNVKLMPSFSSDHASRLRRELLHTPPGSRFSFSTLSSFCRRNFSSCSSWMYAKARVSTSDLFWNCTPSFRFVLMPLELALVEFAPGLLARRLGTALLSARNLAFRLVRYRFSTALWAALRLLATVSLGSSEEEDVREGLLVALCLGEGKEVSTAGGGSGSASEMGERHEVAGRFGEIVPTCPGVLGRAPVGDGR